MKAVLYKNEIKWGLTHNQISVDLKIPVYHNPDCIRIEFDEDTGVAWVLTPTNKDNIDIIRKSIKGITHLFENSDGL